MFSNNVLAEGNVEHWLSKIEHMMKTTLYDFTKLTLEKYP